MNNTDKMQNILEDIGKAHEEERERERERAAESVHGKRRRILIVDDVQFQLASTKERLKKHYDVYVAESLEAMFKVLENVKPDMILLDVNMPTDSGYDIIKQLKDNPRYMNIPVIFLSGSADRKSIMKGMSLGAIDFIRKPFSAADMYESIEYHLDPQKQKQIKPIILAVDDSPSILRTVSAVLQENSKVYTLNDPKQITTLLGIITPDLFLLDCNMPGLSGYDLVPIIRKIPEHEETPIIFLTSDGTVDNISAAMGFGAKDFIIKPIDVLVLRDKTTKHLKDFIMYRRIRTVKE
jgi:putative two-component system response regulator